MITIATHKDMQKWISCTAAFTMQYIQWLLIVGYDCALINECQSLPQTHNPMISLITSSINTQPSYQSTTQVKAKLHYQANLEANRAQINMLNT